MTDSEPAVTQSDRDMAVDFATRYLYPNSSGVRSALAQAFARHRHASEQAADERERVLREALANTKHWLTQLQPALNVMSRDILADIIADHIDPALAPETPND